MEEAPLISVLLAVYEPRMDWLEKQLISLERQTYPRLRLYVADDGSKKVPEESIRRCLGEQIRSFPWSYERSRDNQGSNAAFARLTGRAEGAFFAGTSICDYLTVTFMVTFLLEPSVEATVIVADPVLPPFGKILTAGVVT